MAIPQELVTFDEPVSMELLRMLAEFHRQPTRGGFAPEDGSPPASGVYICRIPEDGEDLAAYSGTGTPPSMEMEIFLLEAGELPAGEMALSAITNPDATPTKETVYNVLDASFPAGSHVLAINPRHGYLVVIGGGGGGGSSVTGTGCPCVCIADGDIEVGGIITTSKWTAAMPARYFDLPFGTVTFPAGSYIITYDTALGVWNLDIGDSLTAKYLDGTDATAGSTLDGTLQMIWPGGASQVKLCVSVDIPEPV